MAVFRSDVQALRAVAVLLVIVYHVWPTRVQGGYVGVDVFFVISGYLITGHLVREVLNTGHIDLPRFYARRARRLLPAASMALVVTGVASYAWMPASTWSTTAGDIAASALYSENWVLMGRSVDYLARDEAPSPVQHFWSLSVEEQFYFLWPLLIAAAAALWRRRSQRQASFASLDHSSNGRKRRIKTTQASPALQPAIIPPRSAYMAPMCTLCGTSFAVALYYGAAKPARGYFTTITRLYELGIGGMWATWTASQSAMYTDVQLPLPDDESALHKRTKMSVPPFWARTFFVMTGFVCIMATGFIYTPRLPFPGVAALLPTLGTLAVIIAGETSGGAETCTNQTNAAPHALSKALAQPWLQYIGGLSYSLYLAHWPVIVMYPFVTGRPVDSMMADSVTALVISWALAHICKRGWEDRFRDNCANNDENIKTGDTEGSVGSKANGCHHWASLRLVMLFTAATMSVSGWLYLFSDMATQTEGAFHRQVNATTSFPAVDAPFNPTYPGAEAFVFDAPKKPAPPALSLDQVIPDLQLASKDLGIAYIDQGNGPCFARSAEVEVKACEFHSPSDSTTSSLERNNQKIITLIGDSHAAHWLPAFHAASTAQGWNTTILSKSACLPVNATITVGTKTSARRQYTECRVWALKALDHILSDPPDAVVLSVSPFYKVANVDLVDAVVRFVEAIAAVGVPVFAIKHTPVPKDAFKISSAACLLVAHKGGLPLQNATATCTPPATGIVRDTGLLVEAAKRSTSLHLLSFDDAFCDAEGVCPPIIGNVLVYRDAHHLSASFAKTLAPALGRRLGSALKGS